MINNKKDRYPLLMFASIVTLRMLAWLLASKHHFYLMFPLAGLVFLLFAIKHNHLHHKIFKEKWQNRCFEYLMDAFSGTTFSSIQIVHLANHHREGNGRRDWGHTKPFEHLNPFLGLLKYILVTPYRYIQGKRQYLRLRGSKARRTRILRESIALYGAYILMLVYHPWNTLVFILLPNVLAQFLLIGFNYLQHSGCDPQSSYDHARNFMGKWLNALTFNNGYHTAHHLKPHLHWSAYSAYHASIESRIDPKLNINNLLVFLWNLNGETKRAARRREKRKVFYELHQRCEGSAGVSSARRDR